MTWFFYSLLSITALASAELSQQFILTNEKKFDERASGVLVFLIQALFTIPLLLISSTYKQLFSPFTGKDLWLLLLNTFLVSLTMLIYLRSFKVKNISISSMFFSLSVVVSTTLGIIFFNETFYPIKLIGIALVLLAIASLNINNVQLEKNHLFGILAGLCFGVSYTIDKSIVLDVHPFVYMFWAFMLPPIFGFIIKPAGLVQMVKSSKISDYYSIILSAISYFFYNMFTFLAYSHGGEVGRVDAINNSQVFLIILFEYFVLKHTQGFLRKLATAVIAFSGVLILGYL